MERHFQRELESLKTSLIKMGSLVEDGIAKAMRSVLEKEADFAQQVIGSDARVDALEIEIDNAIVDMLALQQPVASDLRFILASLKINNDLERLGDHAVNIAESAMRLNTLSTGHMLKEIPPMADITKTMLKDALDSFILLDPAKAQTVLTTDDQIDDLNRLVARSIVEMIKADTNTIEYALELSRISRNLERIADLATNIAEEVIFHTQARVVKHHAEKKR